MDLQNLLLANLLQILGSKFMAKTVNATFAYQKTGGAGEWLDNMAFTMFAIYLLLIIYIFATYLQGAFLCKSIFFVP